MLSRETLESYRRMTPAERLRLTFDLMKTAESALLSGTKEQVARKFEHLNRENELRNIAMLTGIARTRMAKDEND